MVSIKKIISKSIANAFISLEYSKKVDVGNIEQLWSIRENPKSKISYAFNKLLLLSKLLSNNGVQKTPETIYHDIVGKITTDIFTCELRNKKQILITLDKEWIGVQITHLINNNLIDKVKNKLKILVDFSSPNIAKDLHVGHLRSTIIGDSICRYYEEFGHDVLRINHIGDFGLQFGMLIEYINKYNTSFDSISDLQSLYAKSKKEFDTDSEFKKAAYQQVVALQSGNEKVRKIWNSICSISRNSYNKIYKRLGIRLNEVGESFYQKFIPDLVIELQEKKMLTFDDGRYIINVEGHKVPLTVVKSDGGYTYDTTDLAAIKYRLTELNVDKIYYVVDIGQSKHFEMLFKVAEKMGWKGPDQHLYHIGFGLVLSEDGSKFKSRSGDTIKLISLLDEGTNKTAKILESKMELIKNKHGLSEHHQQKAIKSITYSSIKYADLSSSRHKNYKFSFNRMLNFNGNTAVYILYAYVRICGIIRNAQKYVEKDGNKVSKIVLDNELDIDLANYILKFHDTISSIEPKFFFHNLCTFVYKLTCIFHNFVHKLRILEFDENNKFVSISMSRYYLCTVTKKVLDKCFDILGIEKIERM